MSVVTKPWGFYEDHLRTPTCVFKTIYVDPGKRLSLQKHLLREETWFIMNGIGSAEIDGSIYEIEAGLSLTILKEEVHRVTNTGEGYLIIAEMQHGFCSEEDIIRLADDYGRAEDA